MCIRDSQEVADIAEIGGGLVDLVKRRDRGTEDVEQRKGELALLGRVDEADVAQSPQGRRHQAGAHVDDGDRGLRGVECIEYPHLVGDRRDIDDLGQIGMKPPERAARGFGIEGAGRNLVGREVVEQGARHGGLADPAFVGSDDDDCRLGHVASPRWSAFRLDRIGMRSRLLGLRMPLSENRCPLSRDMRYCSRIRGRPSVPPNHDRTAARFA